MTNKIHFKVHSFLIEVNLQTDSWNGGENKGLIYFLLYSTSQKKHSFSSHRPSFQ